MLIYAQKKIKGYFNGSDPEHIYFSPDMEVEHVDLDKLMMKFDNFGQEYLVSENLHGKLSGHITGKLRMHKDLMPIVNESEIHLDLSVTEGRLDNFSMLDVAIAPLLWRLDHFGIDLSKNAAPLLKYAERIFSRPAYIEALTPSEKVMRK